MKTIRHLVLLLIGLTVVSGAVAQEAPPPPVRLMKAGGLGRPVSPVVYADGYYVLTDGSSSVYFSPDITAWSRLDFESEHVLRRVHHDGERWVVVTKDGQIAFSSDRKVWSPFFASPAAQSAALLWRGRYWISATNVLGVTLYGTQHGRYDQGRDEDLRAWDAQVMPPNKPALYWRQGDRLRLMRQDGFNYTTENGDYWAITGGTVVKDARGIFVAEGNGNVVSFVIPAKTEEKKVLAYVQEGDRWPQQMDTEFTSVTGLAYGRGRFVVLAGTASDPKPGFFESADGKAWAPVGTLRGAFSNVVFGSAGFVANLETEYIAIYQPEPWPEKPMPALEPVPVPPFSFKDFGSNSVGSGKQRREIPMTPEQKKIEDLRPLAIAAYEGDVEARVKLAFLIVEGDWAQSNPWRAELSFKEGMAAGVASAARGYAELLRQWKPLTSRAEIIDLYRQSAALGDGPAMAWLALNLETSTGGNRAEIERWRDAALAADPTFAARWAKREVLDANLSKARDGDIDAILKVMVPLLDGDIAPPAWDVGLEMANLAAKAGRFEPAVYLAIGYQENYQFGAGTSIIPKDDYQRLIEQGTAAGEKGCFGMLLDNLMNGRYGYQRDEARALKLARELAETGDADGMFMLAMVLSFSKGEQKDEVAAADWMSKAAAAGQVSAQNWLKRQEAMKAKP